MKKTGVLVKKSENKRNIEISGINGVNVLAVHKKG